MPHPAVIYKQPERSEPSTFPREYQEDHRLPRGPAWAVTLKRGMTVALTGAYVLLPSARRGPGVPQGQLLTEMGLPGGQRQGKPGGMAHLRGRQQAQTRLHRTESSSVARIPCVPETGKAKVDSQWTATRGNQQPALANRFGAGGGDGSGWRSAPLALRKPGLWHHLPSLPPPPPTVWLGPHWAPESACRACTVSRCPCWRPYLLALPQPSPSTCRGSKAPSYTWGRCVAGYGREASTSAPQRDHPPH